MRAGAAVRHGPFGPIAEKVGCRSGARPAGGVQPEAWRVARSCGFGVICDSATILHCSRPAPMGARSSRCSWSIPVHRGWCTEARPPPRLPDGARRRPAAAVGSWARRPPRRPGRGDPAVGRRTRRRQVFVTRDYAPYGRRRDAAIAEALRRNERSLRGVGSPYAVAPGGVRKGDGDPYAVFTPFSKVWRQVGWDRPADAPGDDVRWLGGCGRAEPIPERPDPGWSAGRCRRRGRQPHTTDGGVPPRRSTTTTTTATRPRSTGRAACRRR
jgi:hypothetical protein